MIGAINIESSVVVVAFDESVREENDDEDVERGLLALRV